MLYYHTYTWYMYNTHIESDLTDVGIVFFSSFERSYVRLVVTRHKTY